LNAGRQESDEAERQGNTCAQSNRAIAAERDIVNGVERRIAGLSQADGRDNIPAALELEDAGVFGILDRPEGDSRHA
jgi:hypothetical protein